MGGGDLRLYWELLRVARSVRQGDGVVPGQGSTLYGLGQCYESLGQYAKAMELFEQTLELSDRAGQGKTLNILGNCYLFLGQYVRAVLGHCRGAGLPYGVGEVASRPR